MIRIVKTVVAVLRLITRRLLQGLSILFGVSWLAFMGYQLFGDNHNSDDVAVIIFAVDMIVLLFFAVLLWRIASLIK